VKTHTDPGQHNCHDTRPSARLALPLLLMVATLAAAVPARPNAAQAAAKRTDKREVEARKAFAAGQYQQALELYADLYADKVHPTFLRNIGRCYQNLRQPEKAINAFRDYLRQAKSLTTAERREVEGYIAEMEQLQKDQEAAQAAAASPPTPPAPATVPATPPVALEPPAGAGTVQLSDQTPAPPPAPTPFYKKGWFWGVVGVAVAGAVVGGLYAAGVFSGSSISCTAEDGCY
jgi:hypothetical protein